EQALHVRSQIRGIDQKAFSGGQAEVIGHEAFENLAVLEFDPHPQAFCARAGSESLSRQRFRITEIAHEKDAFNVAELNRHHVAGGVQQLELAVADKMRRGDVSIERVTVSLANDN